MAEQTLEDREAQLIIDMDILRKSNIELFERLRKMNEEVTQMMEQTRELKKQSDGMAARLSRLEEIQGFEEDLEEYPVRKSRTRR